MPEQAPPKLLPAAIAWAAQQAQLAQAKGTHLDTKGIAIARRVGVQHPEWIRVMQVDEMPTPEANELRQAATAFGLLGPGAIGLTFGYGIFVRADALSDTLLAHECRHVYQFEQAGSLAAFVTAYLEQITTHGYRDAPMERDARMCGDGE